MVQKNIEMVKTIENYLADMILYQGTLLDGLILYL